MIKLEVIDDRVKISNPRGLVSAILESEFGKRSHSKNPLNFGLFARMHLVEQVGSGIGRIQDLMQGVGLPEPDFLKRGFFTVMLKRPVKGSLKSSLKSSLKIIELISQNIKITILELAD